MPPALTTCNSHAGALTLVASGTSSPNGRYQTNAISAFSVGPSNGSGVNRRYSRVQEMLRSYRAFPGSSVAISHPQRIAVAAWMTINPTMRTAFATN